MNREEFLQRWENFVVQRGLPYYHDSHQLMIRQLLQRFPVGKLGDLSDVDLRESVHPENDRSFSYFLNHLHRFLEIHDLDRQRH